MNLTVMKEIQTRRDYEQLGKSSRRATLHHFPMTHLRHPSVVYTFPFPSPYAQRRKVDSSILTSSFTP